MYAPIEEPSKRLSKEIIPAMRWGALISVAIEVVITGILYGVSIYFAWPDWVNWILLIVAAIIVAGAIWSIGLRPFFVFKNTRYEVSEEFLQLKSGAFHEVHELVPMAKIQAVSTHQGPILRRFNLYSIAIETMGSTHGIAGLPKQVAIDVRDRIAHLAKIQEVDE
ncbi:PH domain-containing protein [Sporosarcina sp. Sa2YVA2]|uniref:PH domain-containing protein n=1 Tax=Sporosarcina quadrami TaxID=2762234 RepID=A0ABR8UC96_9BACL|nr:PH domain-containing protein [Sporosarcina quadrami]MBD7985672.1 PH domain-containing protein [Sporosarcina quadrami]